jgi:outer membrane protein assembly factor BamB
MFKDKHNLFIRSVILVLVHQICASTVGDVLSGQNWPQWRGPYFSGACPECNPPIEWSEQKNIHWKIEVPGKGYSTPAIWDNQIFLTTTVASAQNKSSGSWLQHLKFWEDEEETIGADNIHTFLVLSIDRNTGEIIWQCKVREQVPAVRTHVTGSWASHSPVTDGKHVYAYFGSHGLYCLDLAGQILWERDLGKLNKDEGFGEGSTPALYQDKLIILRDHEGPSKLMILNKLTGETVWEVDREANTSWTSPLVIDVLDKPQVITTATNWVAGYDLESGRLIWECSGLSGYPIPTPIPSNGWIYVMNGYQGRMVMAIRLDGARGDISGSKSVVWKYSKSAPYTPSALLVDGLLYFLKDEKGLLTCLDSKTGEEVYYSKRLRGTGYVLASPVGTKERIYVLGEKGKTYVIKHGREFEILAVNTLDDHFAASPVMIDEHLYLRGAKYLYCITEK